MNDTNLMNSLSQQLKKNQQQSYNTNHVTKYALQLKRSLKYSFYVILIIEVLLKSVNIAFKLKFLSIWT